jgi:hypothetical protein
VCFSQFKHIVSLDWEMLRLWISVYKYIRPSGSSWDLHSCTVGSQSNTARFIYTHDVVPSFCSCRSCGTAIFSCDLERLRKRMGSIGMAHLRTRLQPGRSIFITNIILFLHLILVSQDILRGVSSWEALWGQPYNSAHGTVLLSTCIS